MSLFETIVIAIVEGLTEFLPVSSTGHMIITQNLLGMENSDFLKAFTVNIQFGAILSVIVLYWKRFFQSWDFYWKLLIAFLPASNWLVSSVILTIYWRMLGGRCYVGDSGDVCR